MVRGEGVWKLNDNVLAELEYVNEINRMIDKVIDQYIGQEDKNEFWDALKKELIIFSKQC